MLLVRYFLDLQRCLEVLPRLLRVRVFTDLSAFDIHERQKFQALIFLHDVLHAIRVQLERLVRLLAPFEVLCKSVVQVNDDSGLLLVERDVDEGGEELVHVRVLDCPLQFYAEL